LPTVLRYIAFQFPSWLLVLGIAVALDTWTELARIWLGLGVAAYFAKDIVIYPWVRAAYEHTEHDPSAGLVGACAVVVVALDPAGWVKLGSERWRAERGPDDAGALEAGARVEVKGIRGHTLIVGGACSEGRDV
jgi:membrane protein implicated in regulation of membrane protease activity